MRRGEREGRAEERARDEGGGGDDTARAGRPGRVRPGADAGDGEGDREEDRRDIDGEVARRKDGETAEEKECE